MARPAAVVTGAASGIGRSMVVQLAQQGYNVTGLDLDAAGLTDLQSSLKASCPSADVFVVACDVGDDAAQARAFEQHMARFKRLDVALLNAGIGEKDDFLSHSGLHVPFSWAKTLHVDLHAVVAGVALAARHMQGHEGRIISLASAAGIFPVPGGPVYAAAKAGVVNLTRSLGPRLAKRNIAIATVCPQYVDTPLVQTMLKDPKKASAYMGELAKLPLLQPQQVTDIISALIKAPVAEAAGAVKLLLQTGQVVDVSAGPGVAPKRQQRKQQQQQQQQQHGQQRQGHGGDPPATARALRQYASQHLPSTFRKVVVTQLSPNFRAATAIVEAPMPSTSALPPGHVLVRRLFTGANASDVNFSSGRYHSSVQEARSLLPFDAGFESVGVVVAAANDVTDLTPGSPVASMDYGGYSEYAVLRARRTLPVPRPTPEAVALLTSGMTASIALAEAAHMRPSGGGQTVLVTAAAGGTGQFAVQLAKLAGHHVVATCGGADKAALLKRLGVDRVINYRDESVKAVLKAEYPKGIDIIYESVGGEMFDTCVNALAPRGQLLVIGMMSSYGEGWAPGNYPGLCEKLLWKSASVTGFFLLKWAGAWRKHLVQLVDLVEAGQLHVAIDPKRFVGIDAVADAVEYLQSGGSSGKVVVQIAKELPPMAASAL